MLVVFIKPYELFIIWKLSSSNIVEHNGIVEGKIQILR